MPVVLRVWASESEIAAAGRDRHGDIEMVLSLRLRPPGHPAGASGPDSARMNLNFRVSEC